jgi:hypothetical protein
MDTLPLRRRRTPFPALWIAGVAAVSMIPAAATAQPYNHPDRSYYWVDAGPDTLARERWLDHAIHAAVARSDLDENAGNRALARLEVIHRDDVISRDAAHHRGERIANAEDIQARLDDLADSIRAAIWHRPT